MIFLTLIPHTDSSHGEVAELVEGAPLLREYGAKSLIEGSNPSLSEKNAPVAQLDRVSGYELEGREFESLRAHHISQMDSITYCGIAVSQSAEIEKVKMISFHSLQRKILTQIHFAHLFVQKNFS